MSALAVAKNQRRDDLPAVDDTGEVYAPCAIPCLEVRVASASANSDGGVVAKDMDLPEGPDGILRRAVELLAIAYVRFQDLRGVTRVECLFCFLQMLGVTADDHDFIPSDRNFCAIA